MSFVHTRTDSNALGIFLHNLQNKPYHVNKYCKLTIFSKVIFFGKAKEGREKF